MTGIGEPLKKRHGPMLTERMMGRDRPNPYPSFVGCRQGISSLPAPGSLKRRFPVYNYQDIFQRLLIVF